MSHFLGAEDGAYFLSQMSKSPNQSAADLFSTAADANEGVFYTLSGEERSLKQIHALFAKKFNRGKYDDPPAADTQLATAGKPAPGQKPAT